VEYTFAAPSGSSEWTSLAVACCVGGWTECCEQDGVKFAAGVPGQAIWVRALVSTVAGSSEVSATVASTMLGEPAAPALVITPMLTPGGARMIKLDWAHPVDMGYGLAAGAGLAVREKYSLRIARGDLVSMYDLDASTLEFVMETFLHTPSGASYPILPGDAFSIELRAWNQRIPGAPATGVARGLDAPTAPTVLAVEVQNSYELRVTILAPADSG